jgi:hypothetical protein
MDSAEEFARLKGETLAEHEGFFRANSGAWIVTASQTDEDGYQVGGPICEVTFKGTAKRGEAYRAPDPEGQANAALIAAAPELYEALDDALDALVMAAGENIGIPDQQEAHRRLVCADRALRKARGEQP